VPSLSLSTLNLATWLCDNGIDVYDNSGRSVSSGVLMVIALMTSILGLKILLPTVKIMLAQSSYLC